jgi:hypothetical protein
MKCSTSLLPKAAENSASVIGIIARKVLGRQIVRGLFQSRKMKNKILSKKCSTCGEVGSLTNFTKDKKAKSGIRGMCKKCSNAGVTKWRNTESGYLRTKYHTILRRERDKNIKCHFTFDELYAAFKKHKEVFGMRSAWGPGIDKLEQHLPITMIAKGNGRLGTHGGVPKGSPATGSNLSVDRLDSGRVYTIQNIIFIRNDENVRKKDSTYGDCKIQIRLHEDRFIKMKAI